MKSCAAAGRNLLLRERPQLVEQHPVFRHVELRAQRRVGERLLKRCRQVLVDPLGDDAGLGKENELAIEHFVHLTLRRHRGDGRSGARGAQPRRRLDRTPLTGLAV